MDLDVVGGGAEVGLRAERLGQARHQRQLVRPLLRRPRRVVRCRPRRLDLEQQVRAHVLDRLEAADRPAELHPDLRVLDAHVEAPLRSADLLGGQRHGRKAQRSPDDVRRAALRADQPGGHAVERQLRLLAGHVERLEEPPREPVGLSRHGEQARPVLCLRDDQQQVRGMAVEHERLAPVQPVAVAGPAGRGLQAVGRPRAVVLAHRQRRDRSAVGERRQELLGGGLVATGQQRVGGEHRGGEVRRAQQRPPHLLAHDRELHRAGPGPAVLLRDRQALQAELPGELRPGLRVVALRRGHQPAHLGRRGLVLQEAAQRGRELALLVGEREDHDCSPAAWVPILSSRNGIVRDGSASLGRPSTRSEMMLR